MAVTLSQRVTKASELVPLVPDVFSFVTAMVITNSGDALHSFCVIREKKALRVPTGMCRQCAWAATPIAYVKVSDNEDVGTSHAV